MVTIMKSKHFVSNDYQPFINQINVWMSLKDGKNVTKKNWNYLF